MQAGKGCRLDGLWTTSGVAVGFMIFENCEEFLMKFQTKCSLYLGKINVY